MRTHLLLSLADDTSIVVLVVANIIDSSNLVSEKNFVKRFREIPVFPLTKTLNDLHGPRLVETNLSDYF